MGVGVWWSGAGAADGGFAILVGVAAADEWYGAKLKRHASRRIRLVHTLSLLSAPLLHPGPAQAPPFASPMSAFTSSIVCRSLWYASGGGSLSSSSSLQGARRGRGSTAWGWAPSEAAQHARCRSHARSVRLRRLRRNTPHQQRQKQDVHQRGMLPHDHHLHRQASTVCIPARAPAPRPRLSTLEMSRQMGSPSAAAALMARSVPTITPSTASTTSSTPSDSRSEAHSSSEKLTWPGRGRQEGGEKEGEGQGGRGIERVAAVGGSGHKGVRENSRGEGKGRGRAAGVCVVAGR